MTARVGFAHSTRVVRVAETETPSCTNISQVLRRLFSFPVLIAAALVFLTVSFERSHLSDPDLWWHLKHGEVMWQQHKIPSVDVYSYTVAGHPYTDHEWLSELTIYAAWKAGSYEGLLWWLAVCSSSLIVGTYLLCSLYCGDAVVALLGAFATWSLATVGLALRPQIIGYLLLVCELLVLHLSSTRNVRWLFALPAIFALWINCHGSFVLGLAVLAVFVFSACFDINCGLLLSRRSLREQRRPLLLVTAISIAALFSNPLGLRLMLYPANMIFKQPVNVATVAEWQRLSFSDPRAWVVFGIAALVCLIPLIQKSALYVDEILLLTMGVVLTAVHIRMMFFFGIIAAPLLCRQLRNLYERSEGDRNRPLLNAALILILAALLVIQFPSGWRIQSQVEKDNPAKAIDFMRRSHLTGRMLNEYGFGGYLIWTAPEYRVFIDSRTDIYEYAGVLTDYVNWLLIRTDPRKLLDKYKIDFCLLPRNTPIVRVLTLLPEWRLIYSDDLSVIIARSGLQDYSASRTPMIAQGGR